MQNQIFDLSESSVVAAFIDKSHIFLMNCCDSRAVLFQDGKVVLTTNDLNVVPFGFSDFKFNPGISFSLLKRVSFLKKIFMSRFQISKGLLVRKF